MNIFYEESGQFKVASVVQKNDATYQVDTQHGKRSKVKAGSVFVEFNEGMDAFLSRAQALAAEIDTDLLWQVCGEEEFGAEAIAAEYFGHPPVAVELAATLMALYAAPMYFYKKAKGVFKAAPEETLKQALAALERKKQQDAMMDGWIAELQQGRLPAEVAADMKQILHRPDKQSLTYKAFTKAADSLKLTPYALARQTGGVASLPQYLHDGFEMQHYPQGTAVADIPVPPLPDLPLAEGVQAFSLDDEDTTEVDDALSVRDIGGGLRRIGIHIAVPSLAVAAGSEIEALIAQRQSTAYFPGGKITMLPDNWIAAFSLDQGAARPALSLYADVDENGQLSNLHSRPERVWISANLRLQQIEPLFNRECGTDLPADAPEAFAHHHDLVWFYRLALNLQKQRGKYEENRVPQYDYGIELQADGRVGISVRERGSPIDTLVSEMMILANSRWAQMLDEHGSAGIFRVQPAGKVRMSTQSEPHIGMGVQHYGWFTSPLRRAADCINQQQLLAVLDNDRPARFARNDAGLFAALRDFEAGYTAYNDFQREMEAYWSLVYLEQENLRELSGVVLKEDLVRINGLPLTARATGIPFDLPPKSTVRLNVVETDSEKRFIALAYAGVLA